MIVADNGGSWFLSGAPSSLWNDDDLHNLTQILGSDFEAVDLTPIVSGLGTATGSSGNTVIINGLNFSGGAGLTQVYFGSVAATSVQVVSDTEIVVTVPAQAAGSIVDVTVVSPYGPSAKVAADQFSYGTSGPAPVVASIRPASGPASGGTVVLISGSYLTGATEVLFGSQPAAGFTVNSDGTISATAPAEQAGFVDVLVNTAGGISAASGADHFTFFAPPPAPVLAAPSGLIKTDMPVFSWVASNITGTSWQTTTELKPGHGYRWSVQAMNSAGAMINRGLPIGFACNGLERVPEGVEAQSRAV